MLCDVLGSRLAEIIEYASWDTVSGSGDVWSFPPILGVPLLVDDGLHLLTYKTVVKTVCAKTVM